MQSFTTIDSACQWDTFTEIWGFLAIKGSDKSVLPKHNEWSNENDKCFHNYQVPHTGRTNTQQNIANGQCIESAYNAFERHGKIFSYSLRILAFKIFPDEQPLVIDLDDFD